MSSSADSDKPDVPQRHWHRWAILGAAAGVVAITVTVTLVMFDASPESNPGSASKSTPDSESSSESTPDSDDESYNYEGDSVTAECESDDDEVFEVVSPSGEYFVGTPDSDPTLWHDDESTTMIDADGDDPDANTFSVAAVNSSGVAVGHERDVADPTKGWRYTEDGETEELSLPDGWEEQEDKGVKPTGINEDGVVVGFVEGESDGKERMAAAKWDPDSTTATVLDAEGEAAAQAIDGDTIVGFETDGDKQRMVKWNADGKRDDWKGPSSEDLEPIGLRGDWIVYNNEGTTRMNLSTNEEDKLPRGDPDNPPEDGGPSSGLHFSDAIVDEHGNVYGTYEGGDAGYIDTDGKENHIPIPDSDEDSSDAEPSDEGGAPVQHAIYGASQDGETLVGARQVSQGEGYKEEGVDSGDPGRVWTCEEP